MGSLTAALAVADIEESNISPFGDQLLDTDCSL